MFHSKKKIINTKKKHQTRNASHWSRVSRLVRENYGDLFIDIPKTRKIIESLFKDLKKNNPRKSSEQIFNAIDETLRQTKLKNQRMPFIGTRSATESEGPSWKEIKELMRRTIEWRVTVCLGVSTSLALVSYQFSTSRDRFFQTKLNFSQQQLNLLEIFINDTSKPLNVNLRSDAKRMFENVTRAQEALIVGSNEHRDTLSVWRAWRAFVASEEEGYYLKEADMLEKRMRRLNQFIKDFRDSKEFDKQFLEFCKLYGGYYGHMNAILTETPEISQAYFTYKDTIQSKISRERTETEATVGEEPTSLAIGNNFQSREIVVPSIFQTSFCFLRKVFFFIFL